MTIVFNGSPEPTVGVELELMIVDQETGDLVCAAPTVMAHAESSQADALRRVKPEVLECTIEVITDVCRTVRETTAQLADSIAAVDAFLASEGMFLIAAGLHPWARWQDVTISRDDRHLWLVERVGWVARQLVSHGVHVHVAVPDGETAIAVQNRLTEYLPLLLGLSASSPFRDGTDSGLASARMTVMDQLPMSGPPPRLARWRDFEQYSSAMSACGAATSIREVWWHVRPHPDFGTVEMRMLDAMPTLAETAALTALTHCLVTELADQHARGESSLLLPEWVVRQNIWRATRYGVDADLLIDDAGGTRSSRELIDDLLVLLAPRAVQLSCERELGDVRQILRTGTGADRQRAVLDSGGSLADVVASLRSDLERGRPQDWT